LKEKKVKKSSVLIAFLCAALTLLLVGGLSTMVFAQSDEPVKKKSKELTKDFSLHSIIFCSGIENREPVNPAEEFTLDTGKVYCFTPVHNEKTETTIQHLWYHEGELVHTMDLKVGLSKRWRTWSNKTLYRGFAGNWEVVVKEKNSEELGRGTFKVK